MPDPDPTVLKTQRRGPYTRAVRINQVTYSRTVALAARFGVPCGTIVAAAIAALWESAASGKITRRAAVAAHREIYRIGDVQIPRRRTRRRYPEGSE